MRGGALTGAQAFRRVVVAEYQRDSHPLWYALAAQALAPMLGWLRSRLRGPVDERDQAVHLAFAEELGRLRVVRMTLGVCGHGDALRDVADVLRWQNVSKISPKTGSIRGDGRGHERRPVPPESPAIFEP